MNQNILSINTTKDKFIQTVYEESMKSLNKFFEIGWTKNTPNIFVVPDRETIDVLKKKQTEDWIIGWAKDRDIYLLDRKNFEKESNHKYDEKSYKALIKHEIVHSFTHIVANAKKSRPVWLWEGIATFLSGQNELKKRPKKLESFLDFYDKCNRVVYTESGFAVEFLVEKYGKEKMLKLIKSLKNIDSEDDFERKFKAIYGFKLDYKNFK